MQCVNYLPASRSSLYSCFSWRAVQTSYPLTHRFRRPEPPRDLHSSHLPQVRLSIAPRRVSLLPCQRINRLLRRLPCPPFQPPHRRRPRPSFQADSMSRVCKQSRNYPHAEPTWFFMQPLRTIQTRPSLFAGSYEFSNRTIQRNPLVRPPPPCSPI